MTFHGFPPAVLSTDWVRRTEQPTRHLGLAPAASTLDAHGGTMRLANREGGGARVTRIMPSAHARAAENLGVAAGARPAVPAAASRAETFRIERPPWPDGAARSCYHGRVEAADDLHRRLTRPAYPRSAGYDPHLLIATGMGPNPPWLMEALTQALPLLPGMRVLDLGCCGRAMTTAARDGGGHA